MAHLQQETITTAYLLKVTRQDNQTFGFCDHDVAIDYDGLTYLPDTLMVQRLDRTADLAARAMEFQGAIDSDVIRQDDLELGLWDHSALELMMINWADHAMGHWPMMHGHYGEVKFYDAGFTIEARPLKDAFNRQVGRVVMPTCDVQRLGDSRCKVSLAAFTWPLRIAEIDTAKPRKRFRLEHTGGTLDQTSLALTLTQAPGYFTAGWLEWTSGDLSGVFSDIKTGAEHWVELFDPLPRAPQVGWLATAVRGCDRRFATCRDVFSNSVNFRGFKDVPGPDRILKPVNK